MEQLGRPIITDPYEALEVQDDQSKVYPQPEWAKPVNVILAPPHLNPMSPEYDPAKDPLVTPPAPS
jgi:hypothetical protein